MLEGVSDRRVKEGVLVAVNVLSVATSHRKLSCKGLKRSSASALPHQTFVVMLSSLRAHRSPSSYYKHEAYFVNVSGQQ